MSTTLVPVYVSRALISTRTAQIVMLAVVLFASPIMRWSEATVAASLDRTITEAVARRAQR